MTQYNGLAMIYDKLMQGIDYDGWADHMEELVAHHGGIPEKSVLDLACGTGSTTLALAHRGFRSVGLDLSGEMLDVAHKKSEAEAPEYMESDMRDFILAAPVGLAVSFQDGINYLLTRDDLSRAFTAVYRALLPGGLFIFDINRVEKLKNNTTDLAWADCGEFALIWETIFLQDDIWEIHVTGFAEERDGLFRKFCEEHRERVIPHSEVVDTLSECGFELLGMYKAFTMETPDDTTRRVFYVAKKGGTPDACCSG